MLSYQIGSQKPIKTEITLIHLNKTNQGRGFFDINVEFNLLSAEKNPVLRLVFSSFLGLIDSIYLSY